MGFSLIFHFMLGMGASAFGVTPPTPQPGRRTVLVRKPIANSPGVTPAGGDLLRMRGPV